MKKLKKANLLQFFLILSLISLSTAPIYAKDSNIIRDQQIFNDTISKAYELRAESIVNKDESSDLKNFYVQQSEIYKFEKDRHNSFEKFFNLSNEKIINMKSTIINFNVESSTSSNADINAYEKITYQWLDSNNKVVTSELGIPHNIVLKNENGN